MKFKITMKDPDGVYECVRDAVKDSLRAESGLSKDEREALIEVRYEAFQELVRKWFRHGEYVDVEIDTEAGTATLLQVPR